LNQAKNNSTGNKLSTAADEQRKVLNILIAYGCAARVTLQAQFSALIVVSKQIEDLWFWRGFLGENLRISLSYSIQEILV
jgi:hypothetical protein